MAVAVIEGCACPPGEGGEEKQERGKGKEVEVFHVRGSLFIGSGIVIGVFFGGYGEGDLLVPKARVNDLVGVRNEPQHKVPISVFVGVRVNAHPNLV
ncbi:MAG: hypothetical protein KJO08_09445 [Gammaproteobacteria bacterium]|nr:hypothetical protein [Gammaproteobacteria bacterium]